MMGATIPMINPLTPTPKCDLPVEELREAVHKALQEPVDLSFLNNSKAYNRRKRNHFDMEMYHARAWFGVMLKRFAKILGWKVWQLSSVIHNNSYTYITSLRTGHRIDIETFRNISLVMCIDKYSEDYIMLLYAYHIANGNFCDVRGKYCGV